LFLLVNLLKFSFIPTSESPTDF